MSSVTVTTSREADAALASSLRVSVMRLTRRLRSQRASTDLSISQLAVLGKLDRHGAMSPGELAAHERVQPPSMTRILTHLEDGGFVVRAQHATDRRQQVLTITPAGHALLKEDRRRRDQWLSKRMCELSPADLATLRAAVEVLDRLAAAE